MNEKINSSDSENKITKLNQKLILLNEEKERQIRLIQELESQIFVVKNDKLKIEGKKKINNLINRFAYMNLKWERSRQIDISDIYKN